MYKTFRVKRRIRGSFVLLAVLLFAFGVCAIMSALTPASRLCANTDLISAQEAGATIQDALFKRVFLTFDDGPSVTTEKILDILKAEGVHASFFVVLSEENEKRWDLTTRMEQEGHCIALHSASHKYSNIYSTPSAFWDDIDLLKDRLQPYVQTEPMVLRFSGGSTNTVSHRYGGKSIMDTLKAEAVERGYTVIDWNVCAEDAVGGHPSSKAIYNNVVNSAKGKSTCMVLMHDTAATSNTAEALPDIIAWFKENDYVFCTVDEY